MSKIHGTGSMLVLLGAVSIMNVQAKDASHKTEQATLLVDDDKVQCPEAPFSTIQAAIDAASPGDRIRVCPGAYHEQIAIRKSVSLSADNGAELSPVGMVANAAGSAQGDLLAAAVLIQNATSVEIDGFRIDGSANGITQCGPRLIGILFQNASGRVEHNLVRHFRLNRGLEGCQSGNGIEVETIAGSDSQVTIYDNSVDDYQKNGVTANEDGTEVTIDENVVSGIGPTSGAAQNGIQIGFGASGTITNNAVANNVWSPCSSIENCQTNAAGILVFQSDGVAVAHNFVGTNQIGIFTGGKNSLIDSNTVFHSLVLDGIAVIGNDSIVKRNEITQSDRAAVYLGGSENQILSNEIVGASFGILEAFASSDNTRLDNRFYATRTRVSVASPGSGGQALPSQFSDSPGAAESAALAYPGGVSPSR